MAKNLILYYSRKGENYWGGRIVDLKKGNTERVAEFIQRLWAATSLKWILSRPILLTITGVPKRHRRSCRPVSGWSRRLTWMI